MKEGNMLSNKNFSTEINELETKETESRERLHNKIYQFGKSLGIELDKDKIEELQTIMTLNDIHIDINREKNIKILKNGFTLKVRYLLYKGWIINWIKNLGTNIRSNINGITKCI